MDEEMLIVCRKIAAHLIRIRRRMREMADDMSQIRDRITAIEQKENLNDKNRRQKF